MRVFSMPRQGTAWTSVWATFYLQDLVVHDPESVELLRLSRHCVATAWWDQVSWHEDETWLMKPVRGYEETCASLERVDLPALDKRVWSAFEELMRDHPGRVLPNPLAGLHEAKEFVQLAFDQSFDPLHWIELKDLNIQAGSRKLNRVRYAAWRRLEEKK